ncbi:MAG: hypothetical protein WEB50_10840 [Vicinamibacterales bacterium]
MMPHDWSPDGNQIAVEIERKDRIHELAVVSVADGSRRSLKTGSIDTQSMAFSPDGRYVAVDGKEIGADASDIHVLSVEGAKETVVVTSRADDLLVGWAPDGRILFTSDRGGVLSLWAQRVERGVPQGAPVLIKGEFGQGSSKSVGSNGAVYTVSSRTMTAGADLKTGSLNFATGEWSGPIQDVVQEYSVDANQAAEWSPDGKLLGWNRADRAGPCDSERAGTVSRRAMGRRTGHCCRGKSIA